MFAKIIGNTSSQRSYIRKSAIFVIISSFEVKVRVARFEAVCQANWNTKWFRNEFVVLVFPAKYSICLIYSSNNNRCTILQHSGAVSNCAWLHYPGALPLWRWHGCKAPKTPYLQCCCHPMTPYFLLIVSAITQRSHTFGVKCRLFDRSHPKTPYFSHSAATGSYFLFQIHRRIDHFCRFRRFFFSNSCF